MTTERDLRLSIDLVNARGRGCSPTRPAHQGCLRQEPQSASGSGETLCNTAHPGGDDAEAHGESATCSAGITARLSTI